MVLEIHSKIENNIFFPALLKGYKKMSLNSYLFSESKFFINRVEAVCPENVDTLINDMNILGIYFKLNRYKSDKVLPFDFEIRLPNSTDVMNSISGHFFRIAFRKVLSAFIPFSRFLGSICPI